MQSLGDLFTNNKILFVVLLVIALAAVGGVVAFLSRVVFGGRISTGGARARQPRLGVVDAFDLDRQRQLVIVRRDNVEHLLLLGGPNDLLVETAIVRAPGAAIIAPARDKEAGASSPAPFPILPTVGSPLAPPVLGPTSPAPPAPGFSGMPVAPPTQPDGDDALATTSSLPPPPKLTPEIAPPSAGLGRDRPGQTVVSGNRPLFPPARPALPPGETAPKPVFPIAPPRPVATPRPLTVPGRTPSSPPVRPVEEPKRVEDTPQTTPPVLAEAESTSILSPTIPSTPEPPALNPRPPMPIAPRPRTEPSRLEPAGSVKPVPFGGSRAAPLPAVAPTMPPIKSLDALESLEEEMAKLLGRPVPPADKS